MKTITLAALLVAAALPCVSVPGPAAARPDYGWRGDRGGGRNWDPAAHYDHRRGRDRVLTRADHVYRGGDGRFYCRRNDGTTGLVVGALGGALLGKAVGGDSIDALLGAAGGAALGHMADRGRVHCR